MIILKLLKVVEQTKNEEINQEKQDVGNKSVYITGALGFIGSHVTRACLEQGWHVYGVDKMTYAYFPDAYDEFIEHPRFSFERSDINDLEFIYECLGPFRVWGQ